MQIAALVYGVFIVAGTRPVYVAFSADRLEVVTAREITDAELAAARDPRIRARCRSPDPRWSAIEVPGRNSNDAMFQAIAGNDEHFRPKFYVTYESKLARHPRSARRPSRAARRKSQPEQTADRCRDARRWNTGGAHSLAAGSSRKGFWTALIDIDDGKPVAYVELRSVLNGASG